MNESILRPDLVPQSHLWHMSLRLDSDAIEAAFLPPVSSHPVVWRRVEMKSASESWLRRLEDTVYDNPLLTEEFKGISCLVTTGRFLIMPGELACDSQATAKAFEMTFGASKGEKHHLECGVANGELVMELDKEMEGFLRRTFYNVKLGHPMAILIGLSSEASQGSGKPIMLARRRKGGVDVVACEGEKLFMANSFRCESLADTLYYIAATLTELERRTGVRFELRVSGDSNLLDEAARTLPRYNPAPYVVPSRMWGSGSQANEIPIELLCEL